MAKKQKNTREARERARYASKKCPHCQVYLHAKDTVCHSCKAKVGDVDRFGIAKKPFNWKAYLYFLIAAVAFGVYIWWAFFSGMEKP